MVELWPSFSLSTGCVVSLRGDWAIFCHTGSGRVGRVWSDRENPLKYSAVVENWTLATGRTDSELSHWAIMTAYLLNPITKKMMRSFGTCSACYLSNLREFIWKIFKLRSKLIVCFWLPNPVNSTKTLMNIVIWNSCFRQYWTHRQFAKSRTYWQKTAKCLTRAHSASATALADAIAQSLYFPKLCIPVYVYIDIKLQQTWLYKTIKYNFIVIHVNAKWVIG